MYNRQFMQCFDSNYCTRDQTKVLHRVYYYDDGEDDNYNCDDDEGGDGYDYFDDYEYDDECPLHTIDVY